MGHYAKDETGRIGQDTMAALDLIGTKVSAAGHGQLGVLVVKTTNGVPPRTFATDVFNGWGIGHRDWNNGILLFVALDDRKAEIILGKGLHYVSTSQTDGVMANDVVRNFKAGQPERALLDGAKALALLLVPGATADAPPPPKEISTQNALAEKAVQDLFATGELADPSPRRWVIDLTGEVPEDLVHSVERVPNDLYASDARPLFVVYFRSDVFGAGSVADRAAASLRKKRPQATVLAMDLGRSDAALSLPDALNDQKQAFAFRSDVLALARNPGRPGDATSATAAIGPVLRDGFPPRSVSEVFDEVMAKFGVFFAGAGGVLAIGGLFWGRRWNRYRPRMCEPCQRPRQMLPGGAEDKHLSAGQQTEQSVGSVDYDVWWCGVCRSVLVRDNRAWFSGYSGCGACKNKTLKTTSTTLKHATEYSTGLVQFDEKCAHCNHAKTYTRTTARITRSSSSSSSSSFSSSSRSSGSSFGGGSSSGRGSSGSW